MIRFILILLVFIYSNLSKGQEQLSLHLENHSGINSIPINPANSFLSPHKWDVNIVSAGLFFENNYGFFRNTNTIKLYKNRNNSIIELDSTKYGKTSYSPNTILLDLYDRKKPSYIFLSGNLTGPSFSLKINKISSIGFISRLRMLGGVPKIPKELGYYDYYNKAFFQSFPISSFNSGFISWHEYGINYTKNIKGLTHNTILGATIKYLRGNEAMFFENKHTFQFQQMPNDSIAALDRLDFRYAYTHSNLKSQSFKFKHNGTGISGDFGITVVFGENIKDFKARLGVSILDIGFINFNRNSFRYSISVDTTVAISINAFKEIKQLSHVDSVSEILSRQIYNDPTKSLTANSFVMWLPMALSIQFDYSISKLFYINGTLIQRIKPKGHSVTRRNLFALSPRFEHRWFSASTSLVVYDWKDLRLGASVRLAYLTIGSDNLLSVLSNQTRFTGSDLYVGLKFNPFSLGKKRRRHPNLNRKIKCYKF